MRFEDKIVVVTGAAAGIGLAAVTGFAAEGAVVVVNDIDGRAAAQAADKISASGGRAGVVVGDAGDERFVSDAVAEILARHGRIDVLVCNAGISAAEPAVEYRSWRRVLAVNLDGPFYWSREVARESMIPRRQGTIVLLSSNAGSAGYPGNVGYVASKHGVVGLTKALAVEWAPHGIRVNCLCPGFTETTLVAGIRARAPERFQDREARIPLGRASTPDEQAEALLFLASDSASYLTGSVLYNDGGQAALYSGYTQPLR